MASVCSVVNHSYNPAMELFRIKNFEIRNRLFVGTGKYASL